MIPALVALGALSYCVYWLRYRASGLRLPVFPDWRPLWLLVLAALSYVVFRLISAGKPVLAP